MAKGLYPLFFHRECLPVSIEKGAMKDKFYWKTRYKASFDKDIFENQDLIPRRIIADKKDVQKHATCI
jgi:hypothetical protein